MRVESERREEFVGEKESEREKESKRERERKIKLKVEIARVLINSSRTFIIK